MKTSMKLVAIGLIGVGVLGAAAWGGLSALNSKIPVASPTPTSTSQPAGSSFTETAKETCGDPPSASATWYGVFIDGGNLDEVKAKYCKDAIAINRQNTGAASIQVASFSDRGRAEAFARKVGGEASRYDPNQKDSIVAATPEYSQESLDAAFLEVQNKTPGLPDAPTTRQMIESLAISYCTSRKKGVSDDKILGQTLKGISQSALTDEVKMMSSALVGTIMYASRTHICP